MRRTSKYYELKYVVECKPPSQAFFEPIAAFNSSEVAASYAKDCRRGNGPKWDYRVQTRHGNLFVPHA
jgi:hypothetical protein